MKSFILFYVFVSALLPNYVEYRLLPFRRQVFFSVQQILQRRERRFSETRDGLHQVDKIAVFGAPLVSIKFNRVSHDLVKLKNLPTSPDFLVHLAFVGRSEALKFATGRIDAPPDNPVRKILL